MENFLSAIIKDVDELDGIFYLKPETAYLMALFFVHDGTVLYIYNTVLNYFNHH